MEKIQLDPKKLLGFRIVTNGGGAVQSPKIGAKTDITAISTSAISTSAIGAKIGTKIP